jgi:hypothetical protein
LKGDFLLLQSTIGFPAAGHTTFQRYQDASAGQSLLGKCLSQKRCGGLQINEMKQLEELEG